MNFKKLVKPYEYQLLNAINHFVSFPSVFDEKTKTKDKPFGNAIDEVLNEFVQLGEMYGFKAEKDSRYVELSLGNKGPLIEVFGHLDVVPATNQDMFNVKNIDGVLYGRGVADDKGPLLASFYAIKALKDNGLIKDCRIKVFAGGDEERGCSCLESYFKDKQKEAPTYGFTPDSRFPIVYGEKGILNLTLKRKITLPHIKSIKGGTAINVVIPTCNFEIEDIENTKHKIKTDHSINGNVITFIGKAAHGAAPHLGINAFMLGLKELGNIYNDQEMIRIAEALNDTTGKKLNAYTNCENLKESTYNVGIVSYENNELIIKINARLPEKPEHTELSKAIAKTLNAEIVKEEYTPYLFMPLDSPLVKNLLEAYQTESKDYTNKPTISGGGTYAKEAKNTLAFGPQFPGMDFEEHQDNEHISVECLNKAMAIYAHAIYNLLNIKK